MSTSTFNDVASGLIVDTYFCLVHAIARKIKRRLPAHVDINDLVQTGVIGLLEASHRYDTARSIDFETYARSRITGAILDELRRLDPCSRHDRQRARAAENARVRLSHALLEEPSRTQIADAVGMGLIDYERMLQRLEAERPDSRYCNESNENDPDKINLLPSRNESPFDACSKRENTRALESEIDQLKPRHREVLHFYYFDNLQNKEIAARMGVGQARICQIHKAALTELRQLIESKRTPAPNKSELIQ
ncbi:MAG TPA: FliA/WhiG family RNA polymerase sigma factor [Candidatus Angelobacter sp.]